MTAKRLGLLITGSCSLLKGGEATFSHHEVVELVTFILFDSLVIGPQDELRSLGVVVDAEVLIGE